jgi:hypothetical protein
VTAARRIGATWALVGIAALLGDAIARVEPYARRAVQHGLSAGQWTLLVVWVLVMVVAEGYRGFQKRFSPRVAGRWRTLVHEGRGVDLVLAPLYCIGYFHAPRRQLISSWSLTAGIVVLILLVRLLDQPWRGIVDAGVLAGLLYGLVSVFVLIARRPAAP